MERKKVLLISLLVLGVVLAVFLLRKKEVLIPEEEEFIKPPEFYEVNYRVYFLDMIITGKTKCMEGSTIGDMIRYNLQEDLSRSRRTRVRFLFNTVENRITCLNDICGGWEIKMNNRTVLLNETCEGGVLEIRFLG